METESDVITYQHFRIPDLLKSPRKSIPPEQLLFLWDKKEGFKNNKAWPFEYFSGEKTCGGRTVCTITTASGAMFIGIMNCSMSQPYLVDYGEDTAYNRARVAQGHECAYCKHIITPDIHPDTQYVHLGESAILKAKSERVEMLANL